MLIFRVTKAHNKWKAAKKGLPVACVTQPLDAESPEMPKAGSYSIGQDALAQGRRAAVEASVKEAQRRGMGRGGSREVGMGRRRSREVGMGRGGSREWGTGEREKSCGFKFLPLAKE